MPPQAAPSTLCSLELEGRPMHSKEDMAGKRKNVGPRDRSTVNVSDESEVRWWCNELRCTRRQLFAAIKAVGPRAEHVRHFLGKDEVH